jgi:hypothetical protein
VARPPRRCRADGAGAQQTAAHRPAEPDEKAIGTYKHTYAPIYTEAQIYGGVA